MGADDADRDQDVNVLRYNESFYRSDPADFLLTRLQLLALAGARSTELSELLHAGVEFHGFTIGAAPSDGTTSVSTADLESFITIESQLLLHHAAETALRLFMVHAAGDDVPWVTLASSPFWEFKRDVREAFINARPHPDLVGHVCLGNRAAPHGTSEADWYGAVEGLTALLGSFATTILDDAPLYNGIKHGLGASPGNAVLLIGSHQFGGGRSVEFPERSDWDSSGERTWSLTTRWVDLRESVGLIWAATRVIDSIWQIGRYRRLGTEPTGAMFFPITLRPSDFRDGSARGAQRMSWALLTEQRRP